MQITSYNSFKNYSKKKKRYCIAWSQLFLELLNYSNIVFYYFFFFLYLQWIHFVLIWAENSKCVYHLSVIYIPSPFQLFFFACLKIELFKTKWTRTVQNKEPSLFKPWAPESWQSNERCSKFQNNKGGTW